MMFLVLLLPQHPLHMWKYQVTLYHFSSRALLTRALNADLQLRKQPALASFFFFIFLLRSWTCGLAWSVAQNATTGWLLLEAGLSVCFHCLVGNERWGVPWSTIEWGLSDACGVKFALCTQQIGKHAKASQLQGPWIPVVAFLFLNTTILSLNSRRQCRDVWFEELK